MTNVTSILIGIVLGALEGTLAVAVMMMLPALVLGQRKSAEALTTILAVQGGAIALIGGAIAGGFLARGGDLAWFRHSIRVTAASLVVLLIAAGIRRLMFNWPARSVDDCWINPISMSYRKGIHVVIYERVCPDPRGRTLNASVMPGDDFDVPTTPGNALVLDGTSGADNSSRIFTDLSETADIALLYDSRERVLGQHARAGQFTVEFRHIDQK